MTRAPDGPNDRDYELGLTFLAALADSVDATALVSIHHNGTRDSSPDHPGAGAYFSPTTTESPRLSRLIVDELRTAVDRFDADWTETTGSGLIPRVGTLGADYYTLLGSVRRSRPTPSIGAFRDHR